MRLIKSVHREFPAFLPDYVRPGHAAAEIKTFPTEQNPSAGGGGNPDGIHASHGCETNRLNSTPDLS